MSPHEYAVGFGLGLLGGAIHLVLTAWRARLVCRGRLAQAILLLPIALGGPVLAVLAAAVLAPTAAWSALPGIVIVRSAVLGHGRGRHAS